MVVPAVKEDPAITQKIIETELIETYHWTFKEIAETKYRDLQRLFIIKKEKNAIERRQRNVQDLKSKSKGPGVGSRKFTREI